MDQHQGYQPNKVHNPSYNCETMGKKNKLYLRSGLSLHSVKGSPTYPTVHMQIGTWLTTRQIALTPHVPGQGSVHLLFWHALFEGQSELTKHSGRQATYGSPKYSGIHWQAAALWFWSMQSAWDPQGEGLQGSCDSVGTGTIKTKQNYYCKIKQCFLILW